MVGNVSSVVEAIPVVALVLYNKSVMCDYRQLPGRGASTGNYVCGPDKWFPCLTIVTNLRTISKA